MNLLLQLTIAGSIAFLLIRIAEHFVAGRMKASWRCIWWALAAAAFIAPPFVTIPLPITEHHPEALSTSTLPGEPNFIESVFQSLDQQTTKASEAKWLLILWALGVAISVSLLLLQTLRTNRRWSHQRLCTNPDVLNLLEDAKRDAGITLPIGIIMHPEITTPVLLGWLRPRILLPAHQPRETLPAIFLHELAHIRSGDILLGWIFAAVRALHWFNPFGYALVARWNHFREEAADELAIRWMTRANSDLAPDTVPESYGTALIETLRLNNAPGSALPGGAFALGESFLKQRITMITKHLHRRSHPFLGCGLALLLITGVTIRIGHAGTPQITAEQGENAQTALRDHPEAIKAMSGWLASIDQGKYKDSWVNASDYFKKEVSEEQWLQALAQVRTPLGECRKRSVSSAIPSEVIPGVETITVIFESSFNKLPAAVESVSFNKERDGKWRASGYFIRPAQQK